MTDGYVESILLVPESAQERLNDRQVVDYRSHRRDLVRWALHLGKDPSTADGYAHGTVKHRAYRIDSFYQWVWDEYDGYTTSVTHDHADRYVQELAYGDSSANHKSNVVKALKMLFKWQKHERGGELWEPDMTFSSGSQPSQPRDYFTRDERTSLREAALEYDSVPCYTALTANERREWKRLLAQRYKMPLNEVGKEEFQRANGFKFPSLVWMSLDAGLRPVEVERASVNWVDVDNEVLRIPADDAAKSDENWTVSIRSQTATMLQKWLMERELYEKYDETDALWLTREGNPYQSRSLKYLLERLCEHAGIEIGNRQISWYAIRHSVGTYMTREEDLAAAQAQLRHKSEQTTMKYDNAPVEDRQDALDRMG